VVVSSGLTVIKNGLAFWLSSRPNGLFHKTDLRYKEKRKTTNFRKFWNFFCGWKFVIFILILFTVCWLPWIAIYFGDIVYHATGMLDVKLHLARIKPFNMTLYNRGGQSAAPVSNF
jgi:hypothetical protein